MVEFGKYHHTMDRAYDITPIQNATNDVGVSVKDIGFSMGLGPVPNIPALAAKMRSGVKKMEITFMGMGKGSGQAHSPGTYGKKQRQALRELQRANKFDFTTHSSVGVMGLAGMDQQGNFTKQNRDRSIREIKRAIDFAADVAQGGPIVVHSGEFFRHMADADWNNKGKWKDKFEMFEEEKERGGHRVIDKRTGNVIQEARRNRKVTRPVWLTYSQEHTPELWKQNKGKPFEVNGKKVAPGSYVDYWNNPVDVDERVPLYKDGKFVTQQMGWKELEDEASRMTERARRHFRNWNKMSEEEKKNSIWRERVSEAMEAGKSEKDIHVLPEEAYIISTLETQAANSRGYAVHYGGQFDEHIERIKKLKKAKEFYKKIEETTSEEEKWRLKRQVEQIAGGLVPADSKFPTQIIDRELDFYNRQIKQAKEASSSQFAQSEEALETIRYVRSADKYGLEESFKAYADAGLKAMDESNKLEKQKKLKRPIAIAVENLFPESYGGHPDELINLIEKSREAMAKRLVKERKMDEKEAKKRAEQHIYATFDTAHCNMWWKYWKGDKKKSMKENKEEFNKWMLSRVEEMAKKKIVGHLHIVDNYGYEDEHLAAGQGNAPIDEALKLFKKYGFKGDIVAEPGADFYTDSSGHQTLLKTWQHFGANIYGTDKIWTGSRSWGNVVYRHFGENQPPYFTFGGYSPSEDWTLWSGVPLE